MDSFFLNFPVQKQTNTINYQSKLLLVGSCFVENIGDKLDYFKFQHCTNPFGIIFHPKAILKLIERCVQLKFYTENDLVFHNEQWHCFEVHSTLSTPNKNELIEKLNLTLKNTHEYLKNTDCVILTFGTAWGYVFKQKDLWVANCHKIPQREFDKKLSSMEDLSSTYAQIFDLLLSLNPKLTIITTVSPVRHIKDGIVENNQSKAHLLASLHSTLKNYSKAYYYPAYELVVDCLRDYRFYKSDLVHPNQQAVDFVWEHFLQTWLHDSHTLNTIKKVEEIQKGLAHKAFNPNSDGHQKFLASLHKKMENLTKDFPFINF